MQKLLIALVLLAFVFIVGCQAPQELKTTIEKQGEQIKNLETKVAEHAAALEQLKMDYEKHLADFHKKPTTTTKTTTQPPKPTPPPKVGR